MELVLSTTVGFERARKAASEESDLIAACRKGEEGAFAELVRRHQRRVFRLAGRFFRRPEVVGLPPSEQLIFFELMADTAPELLLMVKSVIPAEARSRTVGRALSELEAGYIQQASGLSVEEQLIWFVSDATALENYPASIRAAQSPQARLSRLNRDPALKLYPGIVDDWLRGLAGEHSAMGWLYAGFPEFLQAKVMIARNL